MAQTSNIMGELKEAKERAQYYFERSKRFEILKRKWKLLFVFAVWAFLLSQLWIFGSAYLHNNIDENNFCLDKIKQAYPEYNWVEGSYNYLQNICIGEYPLVGETVYKNEAREGLTPTSDETKTVQFALTKENQIALSRDDGLGNLLFLVCFVMVIWGFVTVGVFQFEYDWI